MSYDDVQLDQDNNFKLVSLSILITYLLDDIYIYCKEKLHVNHLLQLCPLGGDACNVTIRGYAVENLTFCKLAGKHAQQKHAIIQ